MKFDTIADLLEYTEAIKGKTFGDFDINNQLGNRKKLRDKGELGKIVETGFYEYENNNESRPDFDNIGVELKVVAYKINPVKKNRVAKERASLCMIDYCEIINEEYDFSQLIFKNKKILFIWYLYEKGEKLKNLKITHFQLYDMEVDEEIFRNDFNKIKEKVKDGKAHKLSEGDTEYLGAFTKGRDKNDTRKQPSSPIRAKKRAYSLKKQYMTWVLNNYQYENDSLNDEKKYLSVLDYITDRFEPFFGKNQFEIFEEISDEKPNPNYAISKQISNKLLGKDKELPEKDDLFKKSNYIIKNIVLRVRGTVKDRMSFRPFSKDEFDIDWEDSPWKAFFEEVKIILICYQMPNSKSKNGDRKLKFIKKISFTDAEIESFGKTYNMVKKAIKNQDVNLLPKEKNATNLLLEVMPHHQPTDRGTYDIFFEKDKIVSFGLKRSFLNKKIYEEE